MLPDGTINPGEMTSFNHYALGAVADWLHRSVAGPAPGAPGFRRIVVRPRPGGGLTRALAVHETPYGQASVAWRRGQGRFVLEVGVPTGVRATVHVPGGDGPEEVGHGRHRWDVADLAPQRRPVRTVRDAVDDVALWDELVAVAVESGVAPEAAAVARMAAPWFDHPVAALPAALARTGLVAAAEKTQARLGEVLSRLADGNTEQSRHVR
jgi:alpha-L-rhamnosidase